MADTASVRVTKDMLIGDILRAYPQSMYALMECGMGCVGCPASQAESVEQAAMVHGLDGEDIVRYLNEYLEASLMEDEEEAHE